MFLLLILFGSAFAFQEYTKLKFHVIRAQARSVEQLEMLREIHLDTQDQLDFWSTPKKVGHRADIMVDDEKIGWLTNLLGSKNISYSMMIEDVEKLILDKEHGPRRLSQMFGKRLHNEGGNRARYPFGEYQSYDQIVDWLKDIEQKYPDRAKVFSMGVTHEGRQIQGIKIGTQVNRIDKRIFWIDGGIHAREWAAVHTVLWFVDRLIADYDDDTLIRTALDKLNFYIIPVANPDGYEYSRSDVSPMVRLWRKNRAGVVCKKDRWFRDRCCGGVDLNRNFDWFFGEIGSSTDKCSEIYQGAGAFSEAESRAIRDMVYSDEMRGKIDGFVTLHTYSQMWIHPFSHQRKTVPEDIADIERVGRAAVSALENTYGTKYKFGTGSDILYPSSGGSDDWAKGKVGAKYVYLLELRPGEDVWDGFILDQRQLIPTAKETWNGLKVVIQAVTDRIRSGGTVGRPATKFVNQQQIPAFVRRPASAVGSRRSRPRPVMSRRPPAATATASATGATFRNRPVAGQQQQLQQRRQQQQQQQQQQTSNSRPMTSSRCFDRSNWCRAWLSTNPQVCQISSIYMRQDCARTCGFCQP